MKSWDSAAEDLGFTTRNGLNQTDWPHEQTCEHMDFELTRFDQPRTHLVNTGCNTVPMCQVELLGTWSPRWDDKGPVKAKFTCFLDRRETFFSRSMMCRWLRMAPSPSAMPSGSGALANSVIAFCLEISKMIMWHLFYLRASLQEQLYQSAVLWNMGASFIRWMDCYSHCLSLFAPCDWLLLNLAQSYMKSI